jgi:predicted NUDIX family NTP pyrophosphohydrolase
MTRSKRSAGILLWRRVSCAVPSDPTGATAAAGGIEVLLAHMGGPKWAHRDVGAWSVPKGEYAPDEDPFAAALREFAEELGSPVPATEFVALGSVTQASGKLVTAWAAQGDLDPDRCVSNTFELEWPPRSGRIQTFPEIDKVAWMGPDAAKAVVIPAQAELVDRLVALVDGAA